MFKHIKTLWQILKGQRLRYLAAIAAFIVAIAFGLTRPIIVGLTVDLIAENASSKGPQFLMRGLEYLGIKSAIAQNLYFAAIIIVGLTAVSGLFLYLKGRWMAHASETTIRKLRDQVYDHLQHLPCRYFDNADTGDLVQRCTSDMDTLKTFLGLQIAEVGRGLFTIATVIPIMLMVNVPMTLVALAGLPVILLFANLFFSKIQKTFKKKAEAEGAMTNVLQENLTGIRVVRAFARQEYESEKFDKHNRKYRDCHYKLVGVHAIFWPVSDFLAMGQKAAVLIIGGLWVMNGRLTIGQMVTFLFLVDMYVWPIRHMGRVLSEMGSALVALGRIREILDVPREVDQPSKTPAQIDRVQGEINFDRVSFGYTDRSPALCDISFNIEAGKTLAILGPSGSGKSTIISLLLKLYDYTDGSITIDGHELKDIARKTMRSNIGVVMQEPFLYSKSLRENITITQSDAPHEQLVEVANTACVHDAIMSFEHGYDTTVGERGVTLSGGQRQRVAIARALIQQPGILILDDALSAVDTRTETAILDALDQRRGRQTTIIIAHRLSVLRAADHIIVLENGQIEQAGTHESLLAQTGLYQRIWNIQTDVENQLKDELQQVTAD